MSQPSSCLERKAHGDEPASHPGPSPRRRPALGMIIVLNASAALVAWLVLDLLWRVLQALLG
jgi:hypothetical protein